MTNKFNLFSINWYGLKKLRNLYKIIKNIPQSIVALPLYNRILYLVYFKFQTPNQENQVSTDLKKKFNQVSNKFFSICEILNEHEYIKIDEIIEKVLCFDFQYKEKKMLCFTTIVIDHN